MTGYADLIEVSAVPRLVMLGVVPVMLHIAAGCGGSSDSPSPTGPVTARVIVTDVHISADDDNRVESITVVTDDGEELTLRLGEGIEPAMWDPPHLLTHVALGESLGIKIGVTYIHTTDSLIATQLLE